MSTPKQIAASRANGAKSKGPATPEGKLVSSRNSTRHGLFAENIVLEAEDTGRFIELVESLFEEHNPRTPTERLLVENIAAARWRQWRIWGMQKVAFDHEVASPSTTNDPPLRAVLAWKNSAESIRTHELLLRYEIALDRQISRSLLRLQQLQDREAKRKEESVARPEPEEIIPAERTQQPPEKKQPVTVAVANPSSTPAKPALQATSSDRPEHPKLPVTALLDAKVHFKRGRQ
jgi:hypothetical protein